MPHYIIKPRAEEDFYVDWSTIVDSWSFAGTKKEFLKSGYDPERLDRADKFGTSCYDRFYDFSELIFEGLGLIQTKDLKEFIDVQWNDGKNLSGDDPALARFIEPFED